MTEVMQNYDFEDAKYGNTYDPVTISLAADPPLSLTGAEIYMQLRKKPGDIIAAEFSTENKKIVIVDETTFEFAEQIIDVAPDSYVYDILIVFENGRRETYIGGKWVIQPTTTRKKP